MSEINQCTSTYCTAKGTKICDICRFVFCGRHIINHNHGGTKGRGVGIY